MSVSGQRLAFSAALIALAASACAKFDYASPFDKGGNDGGAPIVGVPDAGSLDAGPDDAGTPPPDAGPVIGPGPLTITPSAAVLDVIVGQPFPSVSFYGLVEGVPVTPIWTVDHGGIGHVDIDGIFVPDSGLGGTVSVTGTFMGRQATAPITVKVHSTGNGAAPGMMGMGGAGGNGGVGGEGQGAPVDATMQQVIAGTPVADPGLSWLYPYDKTVWPQGLLAPLLQWKPGAQGDYDAVLIHVQETYYEYSGVFAKTATPFIHHPLPQSVWEAMTSTNTGEPITVTLTFAKGDKVYGPITESWFVSQGNLGGVVYYQSYGTNLVKNYTGRNTITQQNISFGGATLSIKPGSTGPSVAAGTTSDCRVCHSVSADGSVLITQHGSSYSTSSAYSLTNNNAETSMSPGDGRFLFPALSPDGTMLFSNSAPTTGRPSMSWGSAAPSALYQVPSGVAVPGVTGLPANLGATLPTFSFDGRHVAFNFFTGSINGTSGNGASLASLDFDPSTMAFSNPQILTTPTTGRAYWSSFLPTNDAVVYELETVGNGRDFAGTRANCDDQTAASGCANKGTQAEIWWVDLATHSPHRLDNLNGVGALPAGPNGHTIDAQMNYEPTVSPITSGGYAWVAFTSRRMYGNIATINGYWSDPRYADLSTEPTPKKLWIAAVDLNAPPGTDPSHPAFYLPGQELLAGNSRAFWGKEAKPPSQYLPPAQW